MIKAVTPQGIELEVPSFQGWVALGIDIKALPSDVLVSPFFSTHSTPENGRTGCCSYDSSETIREYYHLCNPTRWCAYRRTNAPSRLMVNKKFADPLPLP